MTFMSYRAAWWFPGATLLIIVARAEVLAQVFADKLELLREEGSMTIIVWVLLIILIIVALWTFLRWGPEPKDQPPKQ